jgi:hypothetical protein
LGNQFACAKELKVHIPIMDWLGKLLFPGVNRHDRQLRMGSLCMVAGFVVIGAVVALLFYYALHPGR